MSFPGGMKRRVALARAIALRFPELE